VKQFNRYWSTGVAFAFQLLVMVCQAQAPQPAHDMVSSAAAVNWRPARGLPSGVGVVVVAGDPSQEGQDFVLRLKLPDGHRVAPHWHPSDEHLTVLAGTFLVGMGEKWEPGALTALAVGGFMRMPAKAAHFGTTKGETIVQIHGRGPFVTNYVNPADDPQKKTGSQ
jgi:anti-sigma factor ChrR (cupin superfamily)